MTDPASQPPARRPCRVTVVETVVYEHPDHPALQVTGGYDSWCAGTPDEGAYQKRFRPKPEWELLDTGWVADRSPTVLVQCLKPDGSKREPSDCIEVGILDTAGEPLPFAMIPPRESVRLRVHPVPRLYIRGEGDVRAALTVLPE